MTAAAQVKKNKVTNALWGLFIGDALAMPAHWYYKQETLKEVFTGGITTYEAPPKFHSESFLVGSSYMPDVSAAKAANRPYDILHDQAKYYKTTYTTFEQPLSGVAKETGNSVAEDTSRTHYHSGLQAGENTLGAQLARVLMRSVIEKGRYDPEHFITEFVNFLTTPGKSNDPYKEIYLRQWFEHYAKGYPLHACAQHQRNVWSIASFGGLVRPLILSLLADTSFQGLGLAIEHQNLTHGSEILVSASASLVPLLHDLIDKPADIKLLTHYSQHIKLPVITGEELFALYRKHRGPGNIPHDVMWNMHMELCDEPFELEEFIKKDDSEVINQRLATACYLEHGLPLSFYFIGKHQFDLENTLLANANAGGDSVHRGMLLDLITGAAQDAIPTHLSQGLLASDALAGEIEAFSEIAIKGNAF